MSYPSINAKSRALPPATMPPRRRTFNLHLLVRRNSHELPLMKPSYALDIPSDISPVRPSRQLSSSVDETNQSVFDFAHSYSHSPPPATPQLLHTRSASSTPQSRSNLLPTCLLKEDEKVEDESGSIGSRSTSSSGIPIFFKERGGEYELFDSPFTPPTLPIGLEEEDKMNVFGSYPISPRTTSFPQATVRPQPQDFYSPRDKFPVSMSYSSSFSVPSISVSPSSIPCARMSPISHAKAPFNAILLSQKTMQLPSQPAGFPSSQRKSLTLIQLQVAASTFVIPMELIARYPSHLARFISGCTDDDWRATDSDDSFSEAETDFDDDQTSSESSFSYLSDGEIDGPTTPRAATTNFARVPPPRPPRPETPPMSPSRPSMRRLEILLCRSPEPYIAIDYFFSTGLLLPDLRSMLESENMLKGCPLCGDSQRASRLREVENEASWLGLDCLAQVCRAERKRSGIEETRPTKKVGDGWI
ncbi:hypothetical protein [Phaffia rhodozyma]|uniref:Uncharacterized protein n=1 Tax=Phaffia rhodozyma TaxID=264483 RepID=A0A0F7STF0_PHARH|nr:hypothetical protein [Phaffia rhodozyma]